MYNKYSNSYLAIKSLCALLCLLISVNVLVAQHDLSLSMTNSTGSMELGDTTTFNLQITNVNQTDATGLALQLVVPETLEFVEVTAPTGTSYSEGTGIWNINNQLTSTTNTLDLVLKFSSNSQGTQFLQAEILTMDGFDFNSTPANGDFLEDDLAVSCVTVPISIGIADTVQLVAPTMSEGGHVWSQTTDMGTVVVSNEMLYEATEIGVYNYSNDLLECNVGSCCDIILRMQVDTIEICDNGLDDDNDGSVDCFDSDCPCEIPTYPCAADALDDIPISTPDLVNLNNSDYTTTHVLLDFDGNIVETVAAAAQNFEGVQPGIYYSYSLSYLTSSGITGLDIGSNISEVSSPDIEWTAPKGLFICPAIVVNDILITPCNGEFYYVIFTHLYEEGETGTEDFNIQGQMFTEDLDGSGSQQFAFPIPCGEVVPPPTNNPGTIAGTVFQECNDLDAGIRDDEELGFSSFFVSLTGTDFNDNLIVIFDETDAGGAYSFENVPAGSYQVVINTEIPDFGWQISPLNQGDDESVDSDIDPSNGYSEVFDINGNTITGVDAGLMDVQAPRFSNIPSNETYSCGENIPDSAPTVSDNNELASFVLTETINQEDCPQNETITRIWTATDVCGNQSTASQIITQVDMTPPVIAITNPDLAGFENGAIIVIECGNLPPTNSEMATATDNCDANPQLILEEKFISADCLSDGYLHIISREWTATDACGNESTYILNYQVTDTTPPTVFDVADVTFDCSAEDFSTSAPDAVDNCDEDLEFSYEDSEPTSANCPYAFVRVWTVVDDCGNTNTTSQTIEIQDTEAPVITPIHPLLIGLNSGDEITVECSTPFIISDMDVTATDNCDDNVLITAEEGEIIIGDCLTDGFVILMYCYYEATDDCGNSSQFMVTVKMIDSEAPIFSNIPASTTIECNAELPAAQNPTVSDDCTTDEDINIIYNENQQGSGCDYKIIRVWTAIDDCGNANTASQIIEVKDTEAPVITPIHPLLVGLTSGDEITIECNTPFIMNPTDAIATDNCDDNVLMTVEEENIIVGDCLTDGFLMLMYCYFEATDDCGNTSQFFVSIKIIDTTAPTFSAVPANTTANCEDGLPVVQNPTVSDNCTNNQDINTVYNESQQGSGCDYQITRTWTATDDCGNESTASQTIIVQDNEAPTINTVPDDVTINLAEGQIIPTVPTNIFAADNCTTNPDLVFNEVQDGEGCFYQITRTWTAIDDCENTTSRAQILTVIDSINISISTTSDDCEMSTGTANINPENYDYSWSNGLMGGNQTNLMAGTYTVTATNEAECTATFEVIIGATCGCVEFDIEQEIYTDATCNENNGAATVIPEGNLNDYTYSWIPNLGTPNTVGNSRTDLPPGDYLLIILYQGDTECEEKIEFTINNDLTDCATPPCQEEIIEEEVINVEVFNSNEEVSICLSLTVSEASAYNIYLDGDVYSDNLQSCGEQSFIFYTYAGVEDVDENSSYDYSWEYPNGVISGTVASIEELVVVMNAVTENQTWEHHSDEETIVTMASATVFGDLTITHSESNNTIILQTNTFVSPVGTEVIVPGTGMYIITLENIMTSCIDEVEVVVTQNLSPPVSSNFLGLNETAISYDCNQEEAHLCIDIAYNDFVDKYKLTSNGMPYNGQIQGCNFSTKYTYNFESIPNYGNAGPYIIDWVANGISYSSVANNMYAITAQLNLWNSTGNWIIEESSYQIVGNVSGDEYENLIITQQATGIVSNLALNSHSISLSTQLTLPTGINELVLINTANNTQDEFIVRAACITSNRIENTIIIGEEDEMCLNTDELLGAIVSIENVCETENSGAVLLENIDDTNCFSCIGLEEGYDEACLVICDEYGICDTTYLLVMVKGREAESSPIDLVIYSGFSPNDDGVNETFTIEGLEYYSKHKLVVFNRWGGRIFSTVDYKNDWDGTHNNKVLPDGTYFYILDLEDEKSQSGYLQIIR